MPAQTGPARQVLQTLAVPPHIFITAPPLLAELARVLDYPRLRAIHGLDAPAIARYVQNVQAAALIVPLSPSMLTAVVPADPDDNAVVCCCGRRAGRLN